VPIYEYRCRACESEFEKLTDPRAAVVCPTCGSPQVMRLLSVFGARATSRAEASPGPMGGGCCGGGGCGCR
jgi:putative FmdB family regulatory protein